MGKRTWRAWDRDELGEAAGDLVRAEHEWPRSLGRAAALALAAAAVVVVLVGCAGVDLRPDVVRVEVEKPTRVECGPEPRPIRVSLREVEPTAVFDENGIPWVGVTPQHFENLVYNWDVAVERLEAEKAITQFYRDCVGAHNEAAGLTRSTSPEHDSDRLTEE